ncbi:hypothetical protein SERLADRAFT_415036 [Serpula lacrymans var. lacrymans S7.9]|uniref:Csf1 N-terminal domain-containing protein n=1 Tax=Serpula lacrymans var. lacrymans (strain S7.9) TaxID=578457 RepID=F8NSY8_SERL9|nr:uncharacterized protein SERLADRAFT_415036 [Serpula lacrymans var. lacrymans S7.9]EGO25461.1 hypothetical protein SERLADRAFT_415036 [Serpula lacrymans var. lacrymans S7.9]
MLRVYLLVACICILIVSLLYIFYWNRFIALLISIALRIKYWKQGGSSIWVQIGWILLKDVRYHSSNQTIKIVKAQITWRYWLRQPATEDDLNRAHVGGEDFRQTFQFPSCRIKVSVQGFEWFLYNRTAAFDNIISQMQSKMPNFAQPRTEPHRIFSKTSGFDVSSLYPPSFLPTSVRTPQVIHAALDWVKRQMPYLDPKDLLPIAIEGLKGAIICGNPSVPNCMVVEFHRVEGTFGIVQLLNLKVQNAAIRMVENDAFQRPMLTIGHDVHHGIESSRFADVVPLSYLSFRSFSKIWRHLKFYNLIFKSQRRSATRRAVSHVIPGLRSFKSLDEDMPADTDFATLEYAVEREILEAPTLEMSYYVDVVGDAPSGEAHTNCKGRLFDIGNGDLPPEWGIDIVLRSGFIRYGPWADRQRTHLQRIFFPSTYHDLEQTPTLKPGDKRMWTALNIFIELREETTLYIPFREASKNWQWDGKVGIPRPRKREAASIHVTAGDSSTISYIIPMVIGPKGYDSRLEVHLDTLTATSSLNDIKLLVAESCRVHGELPSPLKWNDERQWAFSVSLRQPVLYILRDHINMFTDLSRDWTSGPPSPPNQFVPMLYSFELELHHFQIHLYANDQNIIDKPLIKEENSLIIVRAPRLHFNVTIPSNKYRPESTTMPFFLETRNVAYKALGWSLRYFMVLRDNYLGSFTHFSTLTEYLDKRNIHNLVGDPLEMKYRPEKTNMLQAEISLLLENGSILFPAAFPGYERRLDIRGQGSSGSIGACVLLAIPELQLDFRLHDYFMEMSLNLGTLTGRVEDDCSVDLFLRNGCQFDKEMFIIEGFLGPNLVPVRHVRATMSALQGQILGATLDTFRLNFTDLPNAPASEYGLPVDPDVTFVKLSLSALNVTFIAGLVGIDLSLPQGLTIHTNDLAGRFYSKIISLRLPSASLRMLLMSGSLKKSWTEVVDCALDLNLDMYNAPPGWESHADAQRDFIHSQDTPTHRARFLFEQLKRNSFSPPETNGGAGNRWSRVSHLSESEGEENISEADRDARLAKSRFKAPIVSGIVDEYEESMSGADESDNEDLTDSESLESEVSLSENQFLESPSQREQSPFILTKDTQYSTTIRIDCVKGIEVHVTPLIHSVASILLEELQQNVLSAELSLDAMMASYLSTLPSSQKPQNDTLLDVRISLISVQIPEQILVADQHSPRVVAADGSFQPTQNLLGMIELFSSGCHIISGKKADTAAESWALQVKFETTSLIMWGLSDRNSHSKGSVSSDRAINVLKLVSFRGELAHGAVSLSLGELAIELGNESPRYTTAMYTAVMQDLHELSRLFGMWRQHTLTATQRLIYQILILIKDRPVVDPLSTIQPSFLVQSGRPQELRTDATFKFFFHLRTSLASFDSSRSGSLPSIPNPDSDVSLQALQLLLGSCLNALTLDVDASDTIASSLLKMLFPGETPLEATATTSFPSITGLQIGRLNVIIYDDLHKSPSQLTMTSFTTQLHTYKLPQAALSSRVTFSNGSPRDHSNESIRQTVGVVAAGDLNIVVSPHLMTFAQYILHSRRQFIPHVVEIPGDKVEASKAHLPSYNVWLVSLHKFQFQAAAENLIFEFGGSKLTMVSSTLSKLALSTRIPDQSHSISILFDEVFLRARSKQKGLGPPNQDVLASLTFSKGKFNALARQDPSSNMLLRLIVSLDSICLAVPRSAIRLYRFVEEWRADFLPGMETTVQAFLTELKSTEAKPSSPLIEGNTPDIRITGCVSTIGISLQVMHGTWLSWDIHHMTTLLSSGIRSTHLAQSFEIRLGSQTLSISHKPQNSEDLVHSPHVKLRLPALSLAGRRHSESFVSIVASLDFMVVLVKPSHWDTLLAVQQKFGHDFADLVDLIEETRRKRATSISQRVHQPSMKVRYSGHLRLKGFRLGLEGPSSTFYLGCEDVGGDINNKDGMTWQIKLCGLTISLDPRAIITPPETGFNRNHRSAFVIIDLHINASAQNASQILQFNVTKIQAVMQPSSIGEVGDFVDYLQIEISDRREQRAAELATFKEKTRTVLKTFEIKSKNAQADSRSTPSWLSQHTINVSIHNIGVAFPLTLDQDLELPRTASPDTPSVRAFLFSVKYIKFSAQRGEAGELVTRDLSFQFVPRFRQSVSGDFTGDNHHTRNRLLYPEMTAQHIWVSANVSGFILDLDSSIPDFVFSLIDVYRQGKERMMRLTGSIPHSFTGTDQIQTMEFDSTTVDKTVSGAISGVPTSMAFASLTFQSGQVHVHTGAVPHLSRAKSQSLAFYDTLDDHLSVHEAESIELPVVSVWGEYRASIATHKLDSTQPSILVFKSTIHSSHNTLKPTLLPFITEIVDYVQIRMRRASRQNTDTFSLAAPDASAPVNSIQNNLPQTPSSLQINLSLRIDKSKLELTCQPDVNVTAGLRWDSGGFVVNISPGAHKVTFTGSVDGLTAGLKHGFLSEDCVNLDARNLAFTSTFGKTEDEEGNVESSISLVLDTDLSGGVRFSRLQDVLCFKAVWLDHIPLFITQTSLSDKSHPSVPPHTSSSATPVSKQELTTLILIRLRQVKLEIDLGQSISNVGFNLRRTILRSKFSEASSELSLSVAEVTILAKGNISGHIHVPDCVFQTIRRKEGSVLNSGKASRMLELILMDTRAEPLQVDIHDDWSSISPDIRGKDHPLILSFTVVGTAVVAVATIGAIPKLLSYAHKFTSNLDAQRAGASRESVAFRVTQSPKPDNPLSEVANAMLHSARNRFKEAETELSYVIRQHMSFQLASLRLILFPRALTDLEMAHFIGCDVHASLDRIVTDGLPSWREVYLSFSTMTISKFSQPHQFLPSISPLPDTKVWLESLYTHITEAIIVGLPSMKMHMVTEELIEELTKDLEYDFHSEFVRQRDGKNPEDIYITLNVSLYSWLTILRKNLSREMEQIQSSVDWRNAPTSIPVHAPRKKGAGNADHIREEPQGTEGYSGGSSTLSTPSSTILVNRPSPSHRASSSIDISTDLHAKNIDSQLPDAKPHVLKYPVPESTGDSGMNILPATNVSTSEKRTNAIVYIPRERHIERLTMRQLGEATPDVMHPFFMKKAGFNLEDSLPQYVHEYATIPLEEIMEALLKLYSKQLRTDT